MTLKRHIANLSLVGLVNTSIPAAVISVLTIVDVNIFVVVIGFEFGLLNSFVINSRITFKSDTKCALLPLLISFLLAYSANLGILQAAMWLADCHDLLPQALGMLTFNVTFFLLMKFWVFKRVTEAQSV